MKHLLLAATLACIFSSCEKNINCATSMKLRADNEKPTVGSSFEIMGSVDNPNDVYQWSGPGVNDLGNSNKLSFFDAKLSQTGWYYCTKSNLDCNTVLRDSIYIDVQLSQEAAPCNPSDNVMTSTSIPGVNFSSVTKSMHPTYNGLHLAANGSFGYPSFTVLFNSYNGNTEPKDGVYITTNVPVFGILDEPNLISVSFLYASNFFHCNEGEKVYVRHVNGKLQATFCNLRFSSPPLPATFCSATITEL